MLRNLFALFSLTCILSGCILFKSLDKALEDTVVRLENRYDINLDSLAKSLGKNVTRGVTDELSSDSSKANLEEALGNILDQFSDSLAVIISESKDSLFNEKTDKLINDRIKNLGYSLKIEIEKLLGGPLKLQANLFVDGIIDQLTSQSTIDRFTKVRNSLLGEELKVLTDSLVRSAVRSAVDELSTGYTNQLKPQFDDIINEANKIKDEAKKDVEEIILIAGIVALILLLVAGYFYIRAKRNRDTLKIVTFEIDLIEERPTYDDLAGRIKRHVSGKDLTKHFNEVLKEQALYQQAKWMDQNKQLLELIVASIKDSPDDPSKKQLLKELIAKADEIGLRKEIDEISSNKKKQPDDD